MLCKKPFRQNGSPIEFGCGQCLPCRVNKSRLWSTRIVLESLNYAYSSFITLTYNDENLPKDGSLSIRDYQLFLKKLRNYSGKKIRYYFVGEYGESGRAHYHAIIFNLDPYDPRTSDLVSKCWSKGFVQIGDVTPQSASYVCGYVVKKWTKKLDPRLNGRHPEFGRMSLKPGIGATAIRAISESMEVRTETGDVVTQLKIGNKVIPLGRYLTQKLREACNVNLEEVKAINLFNYSSELYRLQKLYEENQKEEKKTWYQHKKETKNQRLLNFENSQKLFKKEKKL